jgi:hypothetical protein
MKIRIIGHCSHCKNRSFRFEKDVEGQTEQDILMAETLCHDGYGWDLNSFSIICTKCGSVNTDVFSLYKKKQEKRT